MNNKSGNRVLAVGLFLMVTFAAWAQKTATLSSPDGAIIFTLQLSASGLQYKTDYKKKPLVRFSPLKLFTTEGELTSSLIWQKPSYTDATETYTLVTGKASSVNHYYKEMVVALKNHKPFPDLIITVRAFNDGIAFRYGFQKGGNSSDSLLLSDEQSTFRLAGDPQLSALLLPAYTSSHEGMYTKASFNSMKMDTLMDMPLLAEYPGGVYMAITEASLLDYAGMYLMKEGDALVSNLSPLPGRNGLKVKAALPHQSPWRVLLIGNRMGTLMESNVLTTLCPPQRTGDWSWIKPGTSTFPWWNGNVLPDTINAPGNNFVTQQYYIDFCARNNITYHSVVEYGLHQWYTDDGVGFQPGPNPDVTKPVPGLNMKEVCDYAHSKGVDVRVWVHWAALYPKLDSAFAIFEQWGLSGMMVDFMDRDDQEMVNIQTEMLEKAAKHKLHIQFHGAYKPTGLSRTYPNEFTREGTLNYEVHKWEKKVTPDHDLDIVLTRGIAGATDYHLGGFRAVPDSLFRAQYTRPLMLGTRCHSMAMYLMLESALQMVCDYPAAYEGQPGFSLLQHLPTTWDETRWINAMPGNHACVARRKGATWYMGAINNNEAKAVEVPLAFLGEGAYDAEWFSDAPDAATNPDNLVVKQMEMSKGGLLKLDMARGGGAVIVFKKR